MRFIQLTYVLVVLLSSFSLLATEQPRDYLQIVSKASQLIKQYHYNPEQLSDPAYLAMEAKMMALANEVESEKSFVESFNSLWLNGPFSHVRMQQAPQGADAMAAYLDQMNVGPQATSLSIEGNTAVMVINTMMGNDTIQQIEKHYNEIAKQAVQHLIIDLRNNGGGAFAVRPMVGHLIREPLDVGVFVSQSWNANNSSAPDLVKTQSRDAWNGWSIRSFWKDVQKLDLLRVQMQPEKPYFSGQVYVLLSKNTASAAEMAADALGYLPNVTLIGETTAGEMLSQSVFDLAPGLLMFVPIADYYSHRSGRIEGQGVIPSVKTAASDALAKAQSMIDNSN